MTLGRLDLALPEPPRPPMPDPLVAGFVKVVTRLQRVIETETEALSRQASVDLADLNRQKRQGMLELNRALRGFAGRPAPEEVRDRLADLTAALEQNRVMLDVQLSAVREIADIIAQVMRDAEWDGTYSMRTAWP